MKNITLKLSFIFLSLAVLAGCSNHEKDKSGPVHEPKNSDAPKVLEKTPTGESTAPEDLSSKPKESEKPPGDLYALALKVDTADFKDNCNDQTREKMFFITKKLDEMKSEYAAATVEIQKDKTINGYMLGPVFIKMLEAPANLKKQWDYSPSGWLALYKTLTEKELSAKTFLNLGREVYRMLDNEKYRRIDQYNVFFGPQSQPFYESALKRTEVCLADKSCMYLRLEIQDEMELRKYWWYRRKLDSILDGKNLDENRVLIEKVYKSIITDLKNNGFVQRASTVRISKNIIEVSLDAGDMKGSETAVAQLIEDAWKSEALSVKVRWTTQVENPEAYKFVVNKLSKDAAKTAYKDKQVVLPSDISEKTIPHEIGHVLGFRDAYFEVFNGDTCRYEEWSRDDDIMSGSVTALVLPHHFAELDRKYPWVQPE